MPSAQRSQTKTVKKTSFGKKRTPAITLDEDIPRLIADEEGRIVFANAAFKVMAGQKKKTAIEGQDFLGLAEFQTPEDAFRGNPLMGGNSFAGLQDGSHFVVLGGKKQAQRFQFDWIERADGRRFMVVSADGATPIEKVRQLIDDQIAGQQDSTGESGFADEQGEMQQFLNMSHDVMSVARTDGTFERANDTFAMLLGYSARDLQEKTFLDLVHPEDKAPVRSAMQSLMHAGDEDEDFMIDFEVRVVSADGRSLWMDWQHKRHGNHIYSVGRDITAAKEHEEALHRRELQLSEAEAIGHMGHWRWKIGEDAIAFSDEIYRIFGTDKDVFRPTLDSVNAMLHRRDVGRMVQAFQRAIIEQNDYEMDFRVIQPGGDVRYVRCEGRCEKDMDGDVIALYGIMQDITETTLHEHALRDAKESAERAYAAKTQFLANMSHELRTPLNAVIGFSEMMQQQLLGPIGNDRYLEYINGIRESGEHLLDLISDILDMSKIEAGKYSLDLEELNVAKVIKLAIHMMEGRALDSSVKIKTNIENDELVAVSDRRAVMQILLNLLSNAVKFSDKGGDIKVECLERPDYFSIKVHDKGIGIPANRLRNITRPFEQVASHYTREHEGSGLGLAITKELVELHGGTMHIESTVGEGTSVTIRLPYDASQTRRDAITSQAFSNAAE